MARDKNTITQILHGKEVYWERKEGREKETDNDLLAQRHRRKRIGVGGACSLKEPLLHLHRARALLPGVLGWQLCLCQISKGQGQVYVCLDDKTVSILHIYIINTEYKICLNWI